MIENRLDSVRTGVEQPSGAGVSDSIDLAGHRLAHVGVRRPTRSASPATTTSIPAWTSRRWRASRFSRPPTGRSQPLARPAATATSCHDRPWLRDRDEDTAICSRDRGGRGSTGRARRRDRLRRIDRAIYERPPPLRDLDQRSPDQPAASPRRPLTRSGPSRRAAFHAAFSRPAFAFIISRYPDQALS